MMSLVGSLVVVTSSLALTAKAHAEPQLALIKTSNTSNGRVEVHIASPASGYKKRAVDALSVLSVFPNESDGVWQLLPNKDLAFIKTSNTTKGYVEVHIALAASGYKKRALETPTSFPNESDGVWQLLPNKDLAFVKTSNTAGGHVEVHIASAASGYKKHTVDALSVLPGESDGTWQLLEVTSTRSKP